MTTLMVRLARITGRGLALQEALYGFIMAMLFITAAAFGVMNMETNTEVIILIVGMDFTWGLIDMVIFYFVDVAEQKKYLRIMKGEGLYADRKKVIRDNLSGTLVDILDDEDEEKVIDIIAASGIEGSGEMLKSRLDMLLSAFSCFVITLMTTIPAVIALLIVPDLHDGLLAAGIASSVCMFFVGYRMGPYLGTKGMYSGAAILAMALAIILMATFTGG